MVGRYPDHGHPFSKCSLSPLLFDQVRHGEDHAKNGASAAVLGGEPRRLLRQGGERQAARNTA
jgi:hypothetical protein